MKFHSRALAGTALGLFMAASAASAANLHTVADGNAARVMPTSLLMAQADAETPAEKKARKAEKRAEKRGQQEERRAQKQEQPAARAEKPRREVSEKQPSNEKAGKAQRSAQPAPGNAEAPAMKPSRKDRQADKAAGSSVTEGGNDQPGKTKRDGKQRQQSGDRALDNKQPNAQTRETKPEKSQPDTAGERKVPLGKDQAEKAQNAQQPEAKPQMPARDAKPEKSEGATNQAPSPDLKRDKDHRQPDQAGKPDRERNGKRGQEAGGEKAGQNEAGKPELPTNAGTRKEGTNDRQQNRPDRNETAKPLPENAAPALDSNKPRRDRNGQAGRNDRNDRNARGDNKPPVNAGPPPRSDAAAQDFRRRDKFEVQSVDSVKGKRFEGDRRPNWQRPRDADVVKEIGGRVIISLGGQTFVQSSERDRLRRHASGSYYEDLPNNRTRETIERAGGVRVVTVRNEYGDVIRRSRFDRNGREIVLVYVDDADLARDRNRGWRDPGDDLPPMHLTIPVSQYILDSEGVRDSDSYYEFLDQPPVESVERLYSLGEVRRSARLRDKLPRVDLDTINFDTGSAEISSDQVNSLEGVAEAMKRIIDRNPGETFLIEGHTDAVGDDNSNLALSDERAESVADILSDDFGLPPENLVTQGYGEEYLKIDIDGPSRENRRVAIRRITPLVAPVAQQ